LANILIVDDSLVVRKKLRVILELYGHIVADEAENGLIGIRKYKELNPDIVIMDITMPVLDGIEAVKRICKININAKIIMLSAMGQQEIIVDAIKSGALNFIVKPFEPQKVIKVINQVLNIDQEIPMIENELIEVSTQNKEVLKRIEFKIKDNTFIVNINSNLKEIDMEKFEAFINGIINIEELNIIFNFGDIEYLAEDIIEKISYFITKIKAIDGNYILNSKNTKFINYLESLNINNMHIPTL